MPAGARVAYSGLGLLMVLEGKRLCLCAAGTLCVQVSCGAAPRGGDHFAVFLPLFRSVRLVSASGHVLAFGREAGLLPQPQAVFGGCV